MASLTRIARLAGPATFFLIAAAVTRLVLRHVESRVQIICFIALATLFERARRHGTAASWKVRAAIDVIAATVAIVAVKWSIEGTPL